MMTVVILKEDVLTLIWWAAQQSGRYLEGKQCFYDKLKCDWDMHGAGDLIMFR